MKNDYEDYINSNILIFNYKNYTEKQIIEYFTNNKDFITNIIIFREKIKNIISLLKIEDVNYEKFKKYLVKFF
jgi:hypothetical protein